MKKLFLYSAGFIAATIALCLLAPAAGLLISGLLLAAGLHYYVKSTTVFGKVMSIVAALAGLISALSNIPGFVGLIALGFLYYLYKSRGHKKTETFTVGKEDDPFTNFEREWANLK